MWECGKPRQRTFLIEPTQERKARAAVLVRLSFLKPTPLDVWVAPAQNVMAEWSEAWERIEYTPEEVVGNGDTVVVTVLYDGIGKGSGLKIVDRFWYLLRLGDGKIVYIRLYADRNEAREAAGLRE